MKALLPCLVYYINVSLLDSDPYPNNNNIIWRIISVLSFPQCCMVLGLRGNSLGQYYYRSSFFLLDPAVVGQPGFCSLLILSVQSLSTTIWADHVTVVLSFFSMLSTIQSLVQMSWLVPLENHAANEKHDQWSHHNELKSKNKCNSVKWS